MANLGVCNLFCTCNVDVLCFLCFFNLLVGGTTVGYVLKDISNLPETWQYSSFDTSSNTSCCSLSEGRKDKVLLIEIGLNLIRNA